MKKGELGVILFNVLYILAFTIYYVSIKNYEFLWYIAVLVFFLVLIWSTLKKTKFDLFILWGLSIWGFLHMAGGGVKVGDSVLYALRLIPIFDGGSEFFILKMDQVIHFYGFMISAVVVYHLLVGHLKSKSALLPYFIAGIASMGLGALNEVVEFTAVLVFPETGVGGYYNTALDMVFNMLGAIAGAFIARARYKN